MKNNWKRQWTITTKPGTPGLGVTFCRLRDKCTYNRVP